MNIPDSTEEGTTGNYRLSRRGRDTFLQRELLVKDYYARTNRTVYRTRWEDVPSAEEEE